MRIESMVALVVGLTLSMAAAEWKPLWQGDAPGVPRPPAGSETGGKGGRVALHLFETGGHGYGLKGKGPVSEWPSLLEAWLERRL